MTLEKTQHGATLWSVVFILFLIGFSVFVTLKLFPVYMEDFSIVSSLESLENDPAAEYLGAGKVKSAVMKRFGVNNVNVVSSEDVSITRDGNFYFVDVDYEVTVPFIGNISLLVTFSHSASVRASL
ncbi:MAG TPA: DUF4845 domain-containing protein [Gammaproteobacteria bacterium]